MKQPLIYGLVGGVIIAMFQFLSLNGNYTGVLGGLIYYAPMLIYFALIYQSIKKTKQTQPDGNLTFKEGLKAGGATAVVACLLWAIGFFIGLTHTDVRANVAYMYANGQGADVPKLLEGFNKQHMLDVTKFWSMPNFQLGFHVIILSTVLLTRKRNSA